MKKRLVLFVPAAVLLFAYGSAGIHHAFRVHRLAKKMEGEAHARQILGEVEDKLDHLGPQQAEAMVELLMRHYQAS